MVLKNESQIRLRLTHIELTNKEVDNASFKSSTETQPKLICLKEAFMDYCTMASEFHGVPRFRPRLIKRLCSTKKW